VKNFDFPTLSEEIRAKRKVQTRLHALPAGTRFERVRLRFHNLRQVELGALLWALTFGDATALNGELGSKRHRLGMGKPYGLGQLSLRVTGASLRSNDAAQTVSLAGALDEFVTHMSEVYPSGRAGGPWHDSVQVKALLRAADPNAQGGERLDYMDLGDRNDPNSFVGARINGWFMPAYADGNELPRIGDAGGPSLDDGGSSGGGSQAAPPRVGARVRRDDGTLGRIVEPAPKDRKIPLWRIHWDGAPKASGGWKETIFTVVE
jgi:hypothetical protein